MMSKIKNLIILVIILTLAFLAYRYFFASKKTVGTLSGGATSAESAAGSQATLQKGQELLALLNDLKNIHLDTSSFEATSEPFRRLQDYSVVITRDTNPGRPNPFAPLGSDVAALPPVDTTIGVDGDGTGPLDIPDNILDDTITPSLIVSTKDATNVVTTSAKLNGTLNQASTGTTRWFEWGTTESVGSHSDPYPQTSVGNFAFIATGLKTKTTYFYRAVVKKDNVTEYGELFEFTTK